MAAPPALTDLESLARRGTADRDPPGLREDLDRQVVEYVRRRRDALSTLKFEVDGRPEPSITRALLTHEGGFETVDLTLVGAPPPGPRWDYLLPIARLRFARDGAAEVTLSPEGRSRPQRAIARLIVRERYQPSAPATDDGTRTLRAEAGGLYSISEAPRRIREANLVPFSLLLLLYFSDRRFRFEIDLLNDRLEPDIRAGRLPLSRFVPRTSRISHGVDAFVARGELSVSAARLLEVLVETHGLSAPEVAATFGGIHEMANSALEALRARRLATFDSARGVYRARVDTFLSGAGNAGDAAEPLPPMATPALRTSVTELLAAADSRATCPLCGDLLPPGPRGILCAKCSTEVGQETMD